MTVAETTLAQRTAEYENKFTSLKEQLRISVMSEQSAKSILGIMTMRQ